MKEKSSRSDSIIKALSGCYSCSDPKRYYDDLLTLRGTLQANPEQQYLEECLEALGNKDRFLLINALRTQDRCVCELEAILQKSQPAVSHHLKKLEQAHLIRGWKKGKFTHYSLIRPNVDRFMETINTWMGQISNWFGSEIGGMTPSASCIDKK